MKKIKVIFFTILVMIGFLFMGEISILNLDMFQEKYYQADFYIDSLDKSVTSAEMISDFSSASEKYNIDFFALRYSWDKSYLYETKIIGTKGAIKHLRESGIKEHVNKSLFFENQKVTYARFEDENDISDIVTYYFIGDEKTYSEICDFKSELIDKYGGGFPKKSKAQDETIFTIIAVWVIVFSCIIAFTFYEVAYTKKETMVRIIMGESVFKIFAKSVSQDVISFVLIFGCLAHYLEHLSNVRFKFHLVLCLFIFFLIMNTIVNAKLLKINYKRDLSSGEGDNGFLAINYIIKSALTVIAIIVISINCTIINSALEIYKQKDFFNQHNEYSYYKFSYGINSISEEYDPDEDLYREFYSEFQDDSYQYADLSDYYNMRYPFIVINRNSLSELSKQYNQISTISHDIKKNAITLLLPEDIQIGSQDYVNAMAVNDGTFFSESEYGKWNAVNYSKGISVIGIHNNGIGYLTRSYKNPIILVDNTFYNSEAYSTGYDFYYNYDIMYNIPENAWISFIEKNNLPHEYISITNVEDEYEHQLNQSNKKLLLATVLAIFVLFLELSIIMLIIKMEYQFNATEMALMKIHGYSLYERNSKLIRQTFAFGIVGTGLAAVLCILLKLNISISLIILTGIVFIIIELLCIFIKAIDIEKYRISTILKGERI